MEITHVLRGEDLLSSTPRQIAFYDALAEIGVGNGTLPKFGHLPYVMGQGNRKLSKRDPESNLLGYRERGFIPEGLLNYLALLGWAIAEDRDIFSMEEMVEAFEIGRVNPNPARFDLKKCEAINATHLRALSTEELTRRMVPFLQSAGLLGEQPTDEQLKVLGEAAPLVHERMVTLGESVEMLGFLFVDESRFERDPADAEKLLNEDGRAVVKAAHDALAALETWETAAIDEALRKALVEELGLKPRNAFGPVRVAVTGRRISPPLFESLELLGRDRSLARLNSAQES
jgi:glutamyl-tRNA synthetase